MRIRAIFHHRITIKKDNGGEHESPDWIPLVGSFGKGSSVVRSPAKYNSEGIRQSSLTCKHEKERQQKLNARGSILMTPVQAGEINSRVPHKLPRLANGMMHIIYLQPEPLHEHMSIFFWLFFMFFFIVR